MLSIFPSVQSVSPLLPKIISDFFQVQFQSLANAQLELRGSTPVSTFFLDNIKDRFFWSGNSIFQLSINLLLPHKRLGNTPIICAILAHYMIVP